MDKKQRKDAALKILKAYDLDSSALWDCHGQTVIYHSALERVAEKAGIVFERPAVIENNSEKKIAVVMVEGVLGDRKEWSFGEASPGNNKNSYPYAMAEKRAKDRVILKLIGLSGYVYSEEEADDFKEASPERVPPKKPLTVQVDERDRRDWTDLLGDRPLDITARNASQSRQPYADLNKEMREQADVRELSVWADSRANVIWSLSNEARHHLREAYDTKMEQLENQKELA